MTEFLGHGEFTHGSPGIKFQGPDTGCGVLGLTPACRQTQVDPLSIAGDSPQERLAPAPADRDPLWLRANLTGRRVVWKDHQLIGRTVGHKEPAAQGKPVMGKPRSRATTRPLSSSTIIPIDDKVTSGVFPSPQTWLGCR